VTSSWYIFRLDQKSWLCSGKTWSCSLRYVFTLGPPPNTVNLSDVNFDTKNSNFVTGLFSHDVTLIHINRLFPKRCIFLPQHKKLLCTQLKLIALRAFTLGPSPNVSNSSNINLDTEWLHESTPFTDIYRSQLQSLSVVIFWSCKIKKKRRRTLGSEQDIHVLPTADMYRNEAYSENQWLFCSPSLHILTLSVKK